MSRAAEIAQNYLGNGNSVSNFNGNQVTGRPGFQLVPFKYSFSVANLLTADQNMALSSGSHGTAAALATGGFPCDAQIGDGAVIVDFTLTADDSTLTLDFLKNHLTRARIFVERLELTSDAPSQFSKTLIVAPSTPNNVEKKRTIRIKPYYSVNQNSTTQVDMVLGTKREEFWMGPDHVATISVAKSSVLDVIISGLMEIPA